jgi:hypothetical protein
VVMSSDVRLVGRVALWTLALACGAAATFCLVVAVLTLVREEAVPDVGFLYLPGIAVFALGAAFSAVTARERLRRGHPMASPRMRVNPLVVVSLVGVALAFTALPWMFRGVPAAPRPDCPFPLTAKSTVTCVSERDYQLAGAAGQRFVTGLCVGLFVQFARNATNEARRSAPRRPQQSTVEIR